MQSWTETRLWKQLTSSKSPERPSIEGLLQQWMPKIETVLAKAGTSPLDFTLHDAEHSFRVAEWMAKIVPEDVLPKLSVYELALLLLSAYLHDIGMTPEQARVQRHWRHLLFGSTPEEKEGLSREEAAEFQRWLDDERDGLVPPLAQDGRPSEDDLRRAAELITYYARHKHNDWSGEWIRQNATGTLGSYEGWVEDLVRLCQSHHEEYPDLVKEAFDPRPVGRRGEVVHLRYLACVLRVADILDVDPERTPPVLFQHRDIASKTISVIYWYKDHGFWVDPDGSTLVVHASPLNAMGEKATRDTAEWIRIELETCARLSREKPFAHCTFRASKALPHKWSFPESLAVQVRPRNDNYVYIDGAFRPNTAKLLELLSGIQLYKEPLAAVRELLQNAFDAVKEQIALERLDGDPADEKRTDAITALQSVELRFEERDGRFWLLCTDSGVGMTRSIIEKYLLVSGSSRRHDILDLERRCEAVGFHLGRTGQFGIGVLSYFMLADRVEIRTRRSTARGDGETHGWQFVTEGVGSFGELRKDFQRKHGTAVGLRLRNDVVTSREIFLSRLQEYLVDSLVRLSCSFRFIAEGETRSRLEFMPGWQPLESSWLDTSLQAVERYFSVESGRHVTRSSLQRNNLGLREWSVVAGHLRATIRWRAEVGQLADGLGHYRLVVPFFELPGGRSSLFFDFTRDRYTARRLPLLGDKKFAFSLQGLRRFSFQGMHLSSSLENRFTGRAYLGDIDWENSRAGQVTVDRGTFSPTAEALKAADGLKTRAAHLQGKVLSEVPSDYAELNARLNPLVTPPSEASWFVKPQGQDGLRWERLSLPALSGSSLKEDALQAREGSRPMSIVQSIEVHCDLFPMRGASVSWCKGNLSRAYPNRIAIVNAAPLVIIPRYVVSPKKNLRYPEWFEGEFPGVWSSLALLVDGSFLWNREHLLVQAVGDQDLDWFERFGSSRISEEILQTRGRSALYLMESLKPWNLSDLKLSEKRELANDYRPGFWSDVWDRVNVGPAEIASWVKNRNGEGWLWLLGPESLESIPATDPRVVRYLPDPGDEWKLTITYKDGSTSAP